MTKESNKDFIIKTESLVNPEDVTAISFLAVCRSDDIF